MAKSDMDKSSTEEIRQRFDREVERFSNLETGQQSAMDAPLSLELTTEAARRTNPGAGCLLDVGCGAGNYTLKMLTKLAGLHCTLVDLSEPMLERARLRVGAATRGGVVTLRGDIREVPLQSHHFDIILAGAVLHHLRQEAEWEALFRKLYASLKQGGSLWVSDLVAHEAEQVNALFRERYSDYLSRIGGEAYREQVMAYIEREDSPRPVTFQLDLMRKVGFRQVDILHKNTCFAAFGGVK